MTRVLTIFGTRPEAIKMAPVVMACEANPDIVHVSCATGQHRQMLDSVLQVFRITPDYDLDIMRPGQDLAHVTTATLEGVGRVIRDFQPDWVVVQGDTTTAMAGALAAFYAKVKVAHVEAGLRTGNIHSPWPEELNRKLISQMATLHFAPTEMAASNLKRETTLPETIFTTGNTVIDALQWVVRRFEDDPELAAKMARRFEFLDPSRRLILVTGHRRENFDGGLQRVCQALLKIAQRQDVEIVYPVHLNPNVQSAAHTILSGNKSVHLIEPQDYLPFVYLMRQAHIILTDSGGIQEEAPSLGKPVLVTRETTERPEAICAGTVRLVGTNQELIVSSLNELLDDHAAFDAMSFAHNPYGDGCSAGRIVEALRTYPNPTSTLN